MNGLTDAAPYASAVAFVCSGEHCLRSPVSQCHDTHPHSRCGHNPAA
ncbi:hypothetical protein XCR_0838 [Xanthomonas campestris pv. raphani 756C]|nr:hypothetical protein XCR_0838 [Xanthomonas campestris pv. raphani 756C]